MIRSSVVLFLAFLGSGQAQNMEQLESFTVMGITLESTNENGQSIQDMGTLWNRFFTENISSQIENKASDAIYSVFTDYESDYTGKYRAIIGHRVINTENVPEGMVIKEIQAGDYLKWVAKGKMPDAIVGTWQEIWSKDKVLNRAYTTDFEVYGEKSNHGNNSEVEVYIAIK